MVPVGVADEEDLDVGELEPEPFDARAELRNRLDEVAVDEDVALRRSDKVARQVLRTDVVQVPGDAEGREGFRPRRVLRA